MSNILYSDGSCRPNPGAMSICVYTDGEEYVLDVGTGTNNQAEYIALCMALELIRSSKRTKCTVFVDSEVVCRQVNGFARVLNPMLKKHCATAIGLIKLTESRVEFVPRTKNLAGRALEGRHESS